MYRRGQKSVRPKDCESKESQDQVLVKDPKASAEEETEHSKSPQTF